MKSNVLTAALICTAVLTGCSSSSGSTDSKAASSASVSETVSSVEESTAQAPSEYAVGETADINGVKITVNSATSTDEADPQFNTAAQLEEGETYEVIDATVENNTDDTVNISSAMSFELKDADGRKANFKLPMGGNGQLDGQIDPGEKLSGELVYGVPRDGELVLKFKPDVLSSDNAKFKVR